MAYYLDPVRKQWRQFTKDFRALLGVDLEWYYRRSKKLTDDWLTTWAEQVQGKQHDTTFKEFLALLRKDPSFAKAVYELYGKESAFSKEWAKLELDGAAWEVRNTPAMLATLYLWVGRTYSVRMG